MNLIEAIFVVSFGEFNIQMLKDQSKKRRWMRWRSSRPHPLSRSSIFLVYNKVEQFAET
jgi:hypothetical protein